ncbi:MAG: class II aldolase/adducin family protein [Treponema sp.]|jgi:L-fuculose-phosphate aldolase|nr:class II aldolase/adducin family protein [Treponema sp.]
MEIEKSKQEVILAGHTLVEQGLVARTWGNVSCRIDKNRFAITPSGVSYDRLTSENIVVVDIESLAYEGNVKPSSEKGIHAAVYRLDPNAGFVIHTHQTYATAISVAGFSALAPTGMDLAALGGKIDISRYALPGQKKLCENVASVLRHGATAVLMARHGALLTGVDRAQAFERAITLEAVCQRALHTPYKAAAEAVSVRSGDGSFELDGQLIPPDTRTAGPASLHRAIYQAYPDFRNIIQWSSPNLEKMFRETRGMPALLDDFAQMVGIDVKICRIPAVDIPAAAGSVVRALRGRNCVCVRGVGAFCCAAEASDCEALMSLVEKNALAYTAAKVYAKPKPLPLLDRFLMRAIYTLSYSKRK